MDDLKNDLFLKVQEHAALSLELVSRMPDLVANPALLDMTDLARAGAQIVALGEMKNDVKGVGEVLHGLYARISGFLGVPEDQLMSVDDLIELGKRREAELAAQRPAPAKTDAKNEGDGGKYRDAIRKAVANTHQNVQSKGSNVFGHDDGTYFLCFFQKSGSTAKELKFSINKDVITELAAAPDGHLYLVGKDGLIADVAVSELEGKDIDQGRWEFFVAISDDAVASVTGNKRAFAVSFDQFSVGVAGSAE